MTLERLSALDAAFVALETQRAPMHVGWAALFSPPAGGPSPSFEAVLAMSRVAWIGRRVIGRSWPGSRWE